VAPPDITSSLVTLITDAVPDDAAVARARLLLYDYLGVALRGVDTDSARATLAAMAKEPRGPVNLLGVTERAVPRDAAIVNGVSAHSLELDDTHEPSSSHPGTVVWTTLLAAADQSPVRLGGMLDAAVVGYQAMTTVGEVLGAAEMYSRGLHPTAICGVYGGIAAVARMRGLDASTIRRAFGVALSLAAGSLAFLTDGAWTKRLHSGLAASNALLAVDLACNGFSAPYDAFGDANGALRLYTTDRTETDGILARAFDLNSVAETSIKFHPCCRYMHGVMDLLANYHDEAPPLDEIESISCGVLTAGVALVGEPVNRKRLVANTVDAQFSMPFGAALALVTGGSTLEDFLKAAQLAPQLQPWMDRVRVYTAPHLDEDYPQAWRAEVIVQKVDGSRDVLETASFYGSPGSPALWSDLTRKCEHLIGPSRTRALNELVNEANDDRNFDVALVNASVAEL
jgi:2-methylcitrate dehydratase PrpD